MPQHLILDISQNVKDIFKRVLNKIRALFFKQTPTSFRITEALRFAFFFVRRRRKIGIHSGLWPDPSIPRLHLNTCHLAKTRNCQPGIAWWVANSCFAAGTMKQNCDDKVTCQKVQRKPEQVINRQVAQVISPNICRAVRVQKANYVEMITMLFCVDPRSFSSLLSCSTSLQLFGYCSWTVGGHALKTIERERENARAAESWTLKQWLVYCIRKSKKLHVILTVWLSSLDFHNWATNISTAKSFAISAAACDPSGNCSVPTAAARHIKPNSWPQPDAKWNPCCQPMCPFDLCHPFHGGRNLYVYIGGSKYRYRPGRSW